MATLDPAFEASFSRALATERDGVRFVDRFYERFLAADPAVAAVFEGTHMTRQKTMLHDSLHDLVEFARTDRPPPYLRKVAARHGAAGLAIPEHFYALWMRSLLETATEFDDGYGPRAEAAWREVLAPGLAFMMQGGDA